MIAATIVLVTTVAVFCLCKCHVEGIIGAPAISIRCTAYGGWSNCRKLLPMFVEKRSA
jgi:hypothetical protein